jgi:hypothetical protein
MKGNFSNTLIEGRVGVVAHEMGWTAQEDQEGTDINAHRRQL